MDKVITIKFSGNDVENLDLNGVFGKNVEFSGFDYVSVRQFGAFLAGMFNADELVLVEENEDGTGVSRIDCRVPKEEEVDEEK